MSIFWCGVYNLVVGIGLTWAIISLFTVYFERNFIQNNDFRSRWFDVLFFVTIITTVISAFIEQFACLAFAFFVSFLWSLWHFNYLQFGTIDKKLHLVNRRRKTYSLISDERIIDEDVLLKVDNSFTVLFGKILVLLLKLVFLVLAISMGVNYNFISNPGQELLDKIFELNSTELNMVCAVVFFTFFAINIIWINSIELQIRRHILSYLIEAKGLKSKII